MALPWWLPFGPVPGIDPDALAAALGRTPAPQLVDVRTRAEFALGHIAGARNVPITALRGALDGLALDPARPVIAICLTAHRSIPAVRLLRARGLDAVQLDGGMRAWRARHLPETRDEDPTE